jgi:hypothetical protein
MKKMSVLTSIFFFLLITCLNAPHSNKYDPENPHKARVEGYIHEPDNLVLEGAVISLLLNNKVVQTDTSDQEGWYKLDKIDPGVYKIMAEAQYYAALEFYPESLWAGTYIPFSLSFSTFNFEGDPPGTATPYGFEVLKGNWQIVEDSQQPNQHSIPNVYHGNDDDTNGYALVLFRSALKDCSFGAKIKVLSSSGANWKTGIVFRYQNADNYYLFDVKTDSIAVRKIKNGIEETVNSAPGNFPKDIWYTLAVECDSIFIRTYLNRAMLFYLVADSFFQDGDTGLWVLNQESGTTASAYFDDVTIRLK